MVESTPKRRIGRPSTARLRPEPVREEIREDIRDEVAPAKRLTRRRRIDSALDIDPKLQPHGITYEWKRESVHGWSDSGHMLNLRENHWKPVPAERHPSLSPAEGSKDGVIRQDGLILMERPSYLTEQARNEDFQIARDQVQGLHKSVTETPHGQFTRDHDSVRNVSRIKRSYEPMDVPD